MQGGFRWMICLLLGFMLCAGSAQATGTQSSTKNKGTVTQKKNTANSVKKNTAKKRSAKKQVPIRHKQAKSNRHYKPLHKLPPVNTDGLDNHGETLQAGTASWVGKGLHGYKTASGDPYDMYALSGAHRVLPLGTVVEVVNERNNRSVLLTINDRGPYHKKRIIDVSYAAASQLDMLNTGTAPVRLTAIGDTAGRPLKNDAAFYVHISDVASFREGQLVTRMLLNQGEEHTRIVPYENGAGKKWAVAVGPFPIYQEAAEEHQRVRDDYPTSRIILGPQPSMSKNAIAFRQNYDGKTTLNSLVGTNTPSWEKPIKPLTALSSRVKP